MVALGKHLGEELKKRKEKSKTEILIIFWEYNRDQRRFFMALVRLLGAN